MRPARVRAGGTWMRSATISVIAALLAFAHATPAAAHATLESTTPADGAVLASAPREVVLRFDEPVDVALGAVRVLDARGAEVQRGAAFHPRGEGATVAVGLRSRLPRGGFTATYRVVSADSHPVAGAFVFAVGTAGDVPAPSGSGTAGAPGGGTATSAALSVVRAVQFAALALALGGLAVLVLTWLPALGALAGPEEGWRVASAAFAVRWRLVMLGAGAAGLASALLALPLQAANAEGTSFWSALPDAVQVLEMRFGTVWGLGALAWASVLTVVGLRRETAPALRAATVGATGLALPRSGAWPAILAVPLSWLACVPALSGHASVADPIAVLLPANVLHVLAASAWIGGLAMLVLALPPALGRLLPPAHTRMLVGTLRRFSTLALVSVAALLTGGIVQSLVLLDTPGDLVNTGYGRAILIKCLLVAILLSLGALNRARTLPALGRAAEAGLPPGTPGTHLRRAICVEVALGAVALAVTGALAGYAPGNTAAARSASAPARQPGSEPFSGSADIGPGRAELSLAPLRPGTHAPDIRLFRRADGRPWHARELMAMASLPSRGITAIHLDAHKLGPGHYVIRRARLAPAGRWRVEVYALVSDFDQYRATFNVPIQ